LILIGPRSEIALAQDLLEQVDVAQPFVRIEAAVIEVNSADIQQTGVNWDFNNLPLTFTVPGGTGFDFRGNLGRSSTSFTATLQALITRNKARLLASPNVSVVDNEDASIFIGELRRFFGSTISTNTATIQGTDTVPVGIALLVRPHIHPDGNVTMKVHPVVSTISSIVNGLPQTASREADTTVRLKPGEQLVIGGLDQTEHTTSWQQVPILGDLPLIGHFFRSRNNQVRKTQVIVIIRAYPVLTESAPAKDFRAGKDTK
jgi:type II secretory pathway component GspD/PulD (secretin)